METAQPRTKLTNEMCACGRPLHYTDRKAEEAVRRLVEKLGDFITVTVGDKRYSVQRHYIALHGLKGADLPKLAEEGVVVKL